MIQKKISAAIRESGLTQVALAEKVGMGSALLSHKVNGHRPFTLREVEALAVELNLIIEIAKKGEDDGTDSH